MAKTNDEATEAKSGSAEIQSNAHDSIDPRDIRRRPFIYRIPQDLADLERWLTDMLEGHVIRHEGKLVQFFLIKRIERRGGFKVELHLEHFQSNKSSFGVKFRKLLGGSLGKLTLLKQT